MKDSYKIGLGFGLTSAVITTLGLMIGLFSSTHSKLVIIGGILSIAIADAFSDAMGIHVSQETTKKSKKKVWEATLSTLASKFIFALTFAIPVLFFSLQTAIIIDIVWGLTLIVITSLFLNSRENKLRQVIEHLAIAVIVIIITYFLGQWIAATFQ